MVLEVEARRVFAGGGLGRAGGGGGGGEMRFVVCLSVEIGEAKVEVIKKEVTEGLVVVVEEVGGVEFFGGGGCEGDWIGWFVICWVNNSFFTGGGGGGGGEKGVEFDVLEDLELGMISEDGFSLALFFISEEENNSSLVFTVFNGWSSISSSLSYRKISSFSCVEKGTMDDFEGCEEEELIGVVLLFVGVVRLVLELEVELWVGNEEIEALVAGRCSWGEPKAADEEVEDRRPIVGATFVCDGDSL